MLRERIRVDRANDLINKGGVQLSLGIQQVDGGWGGQFVADKGIIWPIGSYELAEDGRQIK